MARLHITLLIVLVLLILGFGLSFLTRGNTEFLIYVGVISFFTAIIALSLQKVSYTTATLISLTIWAAMHLAGGGVFIAEGRLYDVMLIPLSEKVPVFRYDQLVHVWGFFASTLVMYCLIASAMGERIRSSVSLSIVVVMAGLGVGAFNEIVEFVLTLIVPSTGVGGYMNTALDLCADLVGAVFGWTYIRVRYLPERAMATVPDTGSDNH